MERLPELKKNYEPQIQAALAAEPGTDLYYLMSIPMFTPSATNPSIGESIDKVFAADPQFSFTGLPNLSTVIGRSLAGEPISDIATDLGYTKAEHTASRLKVAIYKILELQGEQIPNQTFDKRLAREFANLTSRFNLVKFHTPEELYQRPIDPRTRVSELHKRLSLFGFSANQIADIFNSRLRSVTEYGHPPLSERQIKASFSLTTQLIETKGIMVNDFDRAEFAAQILDNPEEYLQTRRDFLLNILYELKQGSTITEIADELGIARHKLSYITKSARLEIESDPEYAARLSELYSQIVGHSDDSEFTPTQRFTVNTHLYDLYEDYCNEHDGAISLWEESILKEMATGKNFKDIAMQTDNSYEDIVAYHFLVVREAEHVGLTREFLQEEALAILNVINSGNVDAEFESIEHKQQVLNILQLRYEEIRTINISQQLGISRATIGRLVMRARAIVDNLNRGTEPVWRN